MCSTIPILRVEHTPHLALFVFDLDLLDSLIPCIFQLDILVKAGTLVHDVVPRHVTVDQGKVNAFGLATDFAVQSVIDFMRVN